jgi:hypothetical protein
MRWQGDMWREQLRDRRALYVSKGHRLRFSSIASVLQVCPRLHYRLLTLCPAPTDPVGQSWPCVCMYVCVCALAYTIAC